MHLTFLILASYMTLVIYELCGFLACHRVFHISTVRYMSMKSKGLLGLIPNVGDRSTQVLFQGPIHSWQIKCDIWLVWYLLLKSVLWWCLILDTSVQYQLLYVVFYFERLYRNDFDTSVLNQTTKSKLEDLCPIFDTSIQTVQYCPKLYT